MAINDLTKTEFLEFLQQVELAISCIGFEVWIRSRNKNPKEETKMRIFELEELKHYLKTNIKLLRK